MSGVGGGGRSGEVGVMLTRNIKGKRGKEGGEKRGDTEIRVEKVYIRSPDGKHEEETTGLS